MTTRNRRQTSPLDLSYRRSFFAPLSLLISTLALLYAFPWLRIPNFMGVALPLQRLIPWLALPALFFAVCTRRSLPANRLTRLYLVGCSLLLIIIGMSLMFNVFTSSTFNLLLGVVELSKYLAVFTAGYTVYYVLQRQLVSAERFTKWLVWSGTASILLSCVFLILYWLGFRTNQEILAPTFGRALGVWPTGGFLPRLAGTGAEPQQLSVLFLTPLLVMLGRKYIRHYWPIAVVGVLVLVLSQSKFSLISFVAIAFYLDLVYKKHRLILASFALVALPVGILSLAQLPTFSSTLEQGLEAGAFTERLDNTLLLGEIIRDHTLFGIGIGQYGTYRGETIFGDPNINPDYKANSDLLTIFAEAGVMGFAISAFLLLFLLLKFSLRALALKGEQRELMMPYWIGAVTIFTNMFIGYEFLHTFFWINMGVLLYLERAYSPRLRA